MKLNVITAERMHARAERKARKSQRRQIVRTYQELIIEILNSSEAGLFRVIHSYGRVTNDPLFAAVRLFARKRPSFRMKWVIRYDDGRTVESDHCPCSCNISWAKVRISW